MESNEIMMIKSMQFCKNAFGHFRNILVHKYWVYYFGRKLGIGRWRLIKHDISKFSFTEFIESVKYYQGTSSPIPACKKDNGYSKAWQHHKGRNQHHYEYWTDNYDTGITLIPMPFECMEEMIADWCAAGRTYQGKDWSFASQCDWWENKKKTNPSIHELTKERLDIFFWKHMANPFEWWKDMRDQIKLKYERDIIFQ